MVSSSEGSPAPIDPAMVVDPAPPRCIVVTGPRGAGKTQWIQDCVRRLFERQPAARPIVLLAEEGRARMETFAQTTPGVMVRKLFLSCLCCPAAVDLPGTLRALVVSASADWIFVELPVIAAPGLLGEFDRILRWPRSLVVCLTPAWVKARRAGSLSPFQSVLFDEASMVITNPADAAQAIDRLLPAASSA